MRSLIWIATLLCFMLSGAVSAQTDLLVAVAREANLAYESGEYDTAVSLYEQVLADGGVSVEIYFNLGNAYYQLDRLGLALANYLRAQRLSPRDDQINAQIARIRSERVDFLGEETNVLNLMALATSTILTLDELEILVLLVWILFFVILTIWVIQKSWRRYLWTTLITLIIPFVIGISLLLSREYVEARRPIGVVAETVVQVMSGPGENYLPIYRLYSAAEFHVVEVDGSWIRFQLPDGQEGWLPQQAVELM